MLNWFSVNEANCIFAKLETSEQGRCVCTSWACYRLQNDLPIAVCGLPLHAVLVLLLSNHFAKIVKIALWSKMRYGNGMNMK